MGADTFKDFNKLHKGNLIYYKIFFVVHTELHNWHKAKKPLNYRRHKLFHANAVAIAPTPDFAVSAT